MTTGTWVDWLWLIPIVLGVFTIWYILIKLMTSSHTLKGGVS